MKVISFGIGFFTNNKNAKQRCSLPLRCKTVSNPVNTSDAVKAELKYYHLFKKDSYPAQDYEKYCEFSDLYDSNNPEILELLKELKDDKNVSDDFKAKILLAHNIGNSSNAFCNRVKNASSKDKTEETRSFNREVVKAMLEASPNDTVTKKLLTTPSFLTFRIPLHDADCTVAKLLLSYSPNKEIFDKQLSQRDFTGLTPLYDTINSSHDKRKAILDACDYETKRRILADADSLQKIADLRNFDLLDDILKMCPDEETRSDTLYALLGDEEVPLSYEW